VDANTHIEQVELLRLLEKLEPNYDARNVAALFEEGGDRATYEQFCRWQEQHPRALGLFEWLMEPNVNLALVNTVDTPTFYQTLSGVTHLEELEIVELEKKFWNLSGNSGSNQISLDVVRPLVSPPLPAVLVESFLSAFDENQDGHIDFKELSCGVSAACRGPEMERHKCKTPVVLVQSNACALSVCFKIFDGDRDGVLDVEEVDIMADCLLDVRAQVRTDDGSPLWPPTGQHLSPWPRCGPTWRSRRNVFSVGFAPALRPLPLQCPSLSAISPHPPVGEGRTGSAWQWY